MKLEKIKAIAAQRTKPQFEDSYYVTRKPMVTFESDEDVQFFFMAANHFDKLLKVAEAGQAVIDFLNPMFIESDEVIVNLKKALEDLKERE